MTIRRDATLRSACFAEKWQIFGIRTNLTILLAALLLLCWQQNMDDTMNILQRATDAVDEAWRRLKTNPSAETEAAYDSAYADWKKLAPAGDRGAGRPTSVEQTALTSAERAIWTRMRQQQSASRWGKVAPAIQQIRRAAEEGNDAAVLQVAKSIAKETEMLLQDFSVIHAQPDSDVVVLHGWHDKQMVLAFIPKIHIEDALRRDRLSGKEANLIVDRNLDVFAGLASEKYERGEYRPYARFGSTLPRVDITSEEVEAVRHVLTGTVLDLKAGWMGPDGRLFPG
jgi:hypothetical protein